MFQFVLLLWIHFIQRCCADSDEDVLTANYLITATSNREKVSEGLHLDIDIDIVQVGRGVQQLQRLLVQNVGHRVSL